MSRQIETTLFSLMPSFSGDLPSSLVNTAASLLSQSQHRASMLKADEEVARLYACANIACNRLKITLDLPPIEPRPPIPPRIYKRLYTHLDQILANSTSNGRPNLGRVRTPSTRLRSGDNSLASPSRSLPSRQTPTKESSLAQFRTSAKDNATPAKSARKATDTSSDDQIYPWIRPVVRFMCSEVGHGHVSPTVMAGIESILTPGGRRTEDEWVNNHVTQLVAVIFFFVIMRLQSPTSEEPIDRASYTPLRKETISLLSRARKEVVVKTLDEDAEWVEWEVPKSREFDAAVAQVNEKEWLKNDWYIGITDVLQSKQQDLDVNMDPDFESQIQARRADTMFLEKYDYLSEARRADYATWKEITLSRISQLVAGGDSAMDVDG